MSKKVITFYDSEKQEHDFPIITPDYGVCDTIASDANKIVTCDEFTLFTGATVTVNFKNAPTTNTISLNVNDSGLIAVDFNSNDCVAKDEIKANGCYDFIYNGTKWIYKGSSANKVDKVSGKSLIDKSFADNVSTSGNTTTIDQQLKTYSITTRLEADVAITGLDENGQEVTKHKLSEKANSSAVNKHIDGTADRHTADMIDYSDTETVKAKLDKAAILGEQRGSSIILHDENYESLEESGGLSGGYRAIFGNNEIRLTNYDSSTNDEHKFIVSLREDTFTSSSYEPSYFEVETFRNYESHKLTEKANSSDVLEKTNTTEFTPTADYQPATKKYVDDSVSSVGSGDMLKSVYDKDNDGIIDDVALLQYYGTTDITISDSSYFTVNETGETITGLTATGKTQAELVIPYEINGVEITKLEGSVIDGFPQSFLYGSSVTKVVIPKSVTTLGGAAFIHCSSLKSIDIPNSVTSIEDDAFGGCSLLASITIPNSVTSIGYGAFVGCSSLTSVKIPNSVTNIANGAFGGRNPATLTIYCEQGSYAETYAKNNNNSVVYTDMKAEVIDNKADKSTTLSGYGITDAYTKREIDSKISNVYEIKGNSTVANLPTNPEVGDVYNITDSGTITGTEIVLSTGDNVVYTSEGWDKLAATVDLSSYATEIELERLKYYDDKDIIPSPENYFTVNETGETITGLTDTGKTQTELVIPYEINGKKITTLFSGSDSGRPVSILDGNSTITKVVIPKSVTTLGRGAFYSCAHLININIPNSVTSIGDYTFNTCIGLTSINIPSSVTSIGSFAFSGCSSLKSINIPNSVTSIGDYAFSDCMALTSVNIPNSVTSIGDYAFNNCSSLASITIPNSVTSIVDGAFYNCSSLTSANIPNTVTSIGNDAFYGCSSLTSINIPNSVTSIGSSTFAGCSSNFTIYCEQGSYAETYAKNNNNSVVYTDMKATALDNKVDKVEGKSLIDENVANNLSSDTTTVRIKKGTELKTNGSEINGVRIDDNSVTVEDVKNDMSDPYIGYKNVMDKDGLHIYGVDPGGNQDTNERVDITSSGVKYSGAQGNGRTLKLGFEGAGFPQLTMDGNPGESKSVKIDFDDVIVQNESTTHKLSEKVDKVEGKSLIDTGVANNISYASSSGLKLGNRWSFNVAEMIHTSPAGGAQDLKFAIDSGLTLTTAADSGDFDITLVKGSKTHKLSEKLSTIRIADGENAGSLKIGRTAYLSTEGPYSIAIGFGGHTGPDAFGAVAINGGEALGAGSVAFDSCTAKGNGQIAFGRLNITDTDNKYACIIGNGHVDSKGNKVYSNAYTIDWNGNGWFAGDVEGAKDGVTHKLSEKANASDVLTKTNSTEFTPTADYQPATKKYVDNITSSFVSGKVTTITVPTTGWTTSTDTNGTTYYSINITDSILTSTGYPITDVVLPSDIVAARLQSEAYQNVNKITVNDGSVTLYCFDSLPTVSFQIRIQIMYF